MYTLFFLLHHARRPLLLLTPCRRSLEQKPSIYETRVVKKFFEQHDDPATTCGISDYVQEVNNMHTPHHNAEKAPRPPPALAPHEVRCGARLMPAKAVFFFCQRTSMSSAALIMFTDMNTLQTLRIIRPLVPIPGLVFLQLRHLRVYAEDALVLGEGSRTGVAQTAPKGGGGEGREAFMVAIAPDASCKEVGQLEMDRRAILQGCRDGFAACYDTFVGGAASSLAEGGGEGALGDDKAAMADLAPM